MLELEYMLGTWLPDYPPNIWWLPNAPLTLSGPVRAHLVPAASA